jgi:putative MATE family efflux protein
MKIPFTPAGLKSAPVEKAVVHRDWTKGSITKNLLMLSWPIVTLNILWTINMLLELVWLGRISEAAIAGVGVAGLVVTLVMTVKTGITTGERAMVARFMGAGDVAAANHIAGQAYVISAAYAVFSALIGIFLSRPILNLFALSPEATAAGIAYLQIVLTGWGTEAFWITSFSVMQSAGDSVTPMKVAFFIRSVNAVLNPFIILGWWIFPRLGVRGAAITYITVMGLAMVITLWVVCSGHTRLHVRGRDFLPDFKTIWRMLKIGIPSSIMGLGRSFGDLALTRFMTPFGTLAVAAHSLTSRVEMLIRMPGSSLGMGAMVLVGQNLGAKQPKQAARSGWIAIALGQAFIVVCSAIIMVWAESIVSIFTTDPELIKLGAIFFRIAIAGYLTMYFVYIFQSCVNGAGDTIVAMFITLGMVWLVQLPLSFVLSRYTDLGMYGVRWAIVISFIIGAIAYTAYFWQGRWKRKKV